MIDPARYGVSFSLKQCRNFQLDPTETLAWLIDEAGFRRFRLMSYWNEHEKSPGNYDFSALDKQIRQIGQSGGVITLCLGARQPRWPENHWPEWAWQASKPERTRALLRYIETVVERYKDNPTITSYQLENEALLKQFGERPEIDRPRLRAEFNLVKQLDPHKPIIMSTSNAWGVPVRRPTPDVVGFSYYEVVYSGGAYHNTVHKPWLHRLRGHIISAIKRRPTFIHELQLEPWGHEAIWKMTSDEQARSMSIEQIARNLELARGTGLYPIDLWGGEWWYWRIKHGDPSIWQAVRKHLTQA